MRLFKRTACFCVIVFQQFNWTFIHAQESAIGDKFVSVDVLNAVMSLELGAYYDFRVNEDHAWEFAYAYRALKFNMIANGGYGGDYKYWPQLAHVARIGYKKYGNKNTKSSITKYNYRLYRLNYWNLHTPKYTNRKGSNGLNEITRQRVSIDKNLINPVMGIGIEKCFGKHYWVNYVITTGAAIGVKKTHLYSQGGSGEDDSIFFPPNTFEYDPAFFPTVEFNIKIGKKL